jgi:transposase
MYVRLLSFGKRKGRPSIDQEVLLRILLLGYLYGITSERKLLEELRMHLAWRWFTGLGFDQEAELGRFLSNNERLSIDCKGSVDRCVDR